MENYKKCKVENCENKVHYKSGQYEGFCNKHYIQLYRYGKIFKRTYRDKNEIIDRGDYYEICLYQGRLEQKEVGKIKIDKEDLDKVKDYKWHLTDQGYAKARINKRLIPIYHFILGYPPKGYEVDHRDTDPLNNRKYNLRFATHRQNLRNRKAKGYWWDKSRKKWQVQITKDYKHISLGYFIDEQTAAKVAREAKQKYFGEFAYKKN